METRPDSSSPDGLWVWNGTQWLPTGLWSWTGTRWIWVPHLQRTARFTLDPAWRHRDTLVVVAWLTAVPLALAAAVTIDCVAFGLSARAVLASSLSAFAVWVVIGGLVVRHEGRSWESFLVAAAPVAMLCVTYLVALFAAPDPTNQNDHAAGIGTILIVIITLPPSVVLVLAGKHTRRAITYLFANN